MDLRKSTLLDEAKEKILNWSLKSHCIFNEKRNIKCAWPLRRPVSLRRLIEMCGAIYLYLWIIVYQCNLVSNLILRNDVDSCWSSIQKKTWQQANTRLETCYNYIFRHRTWLHINLHKYVKQQFNSFVASIVRYKHFGFMFVVPCIAELY